MGVGGRGYIKLLALEALESISMNIHTQYSIIMILESNVDCYSLQKWTELVITVSLT